MFAQLQSTEMLAQHANLSCLPGQHMILLGGDTYLWH